jgi:hypothetical protein
MLYYPLYSCMREPFLHHLRYLADVHDIEWQYRDIPISKVKTLMSYSISVQYRDILISKFSLRYQRFGRFWVRYVIPGAAGRSGPAHQPRSSPADSDGSSLLVLDPLGRSVFLRDCLDALSCWSSEAAFCCCSGQTLVTVWTAGWSRWAVLISSYRSTSDLVIIQMMSVKYVSTLSMVSCLHSASDASVFAVPGAEPARPAATD